MKKLNDTLIKFNTLKSLYGAHNLSKRILTTRLGINSRLDYNYIKEKKFNQLNTLVNKSLVGRKLQESIKENISFIRNIKTYKELRHKASLPVRGQRTHKNTKTSKKKSKKKQIYKSNKLPSPVIDINKVLKSFLLQHKKFITTSKQEL